MRHPHSFMLSSSGWQSVRDALHICFLRLLRAILLHAYLFKGSGFSVGELDKEECCVASQAHS